MRELHGVWGTMGQLGSFAGEASGVVHWWLPDAVCKVITPFEEFRVLAAVLSAFPPPSVV